MIVVISYIMRNKSPNVRLEVIADVEIVLIKISYTKQMETLIKLLYSLDYL